MPISTKTIVITIRKLLSVSFITTKDFYRLHDYRRSL